MRKHTYSELVVAVYTKDTGTIDDAVEDIITHNKVTYSEIPEHVKSNLASMASFAIESIHSGLPEGMQVSISFSMLPEHLKVLGEA